jgi:hypothetical protein
MLKKVRKDIDKKRGILYSINVAYHMYAALAQSVERRLGKAEVGGSIPLGSFEKPLLFKGFF